MLAKALRYACIANSVYLTSSMSHSFVVVPSENCSICYNDDDDDVKTQNAHAV